MPDWGKIGVCGDILESYRLKEFDVFKVKKLRLFDG